MAIEDTLQKIGLSTEETDIYLSLLTNGSQSASKLASTTSVKRTYVYKITQELIAKGLLTQRMVGKTSVFVPLPPDRLITLAEAKKVEAAQAEHQLEGIITELTRKYTSIEEKPLISFYEGLEGLKKVYKDINKEKQDILLFRSFYDDKRTDIEKTVLEQVKKQVELNIHARVIGPVEADAPQRYGTVNEANLVKERFTNKDSFILPAQIIVYAQKVAIISLKKNIVVTLINNPDINKTFKVIFEFIWQLIEAEHKKIVSAWS